MAKIGYSIQGLVAKVKDTVLSKWLIWLVCGGTLHFYQNYTNSAQHLQYPLPNCYEFIIGKNCHDFI